MLIRTLIALVPFLAATQSVHAQASDIEDVPSLDLKAGENDDMRYFLIGAPEKKSKKKHKLLLVLPGGDGSAEFNAFVRRIKKNALDDSYLVAQLVAPKWSDDQFESLVWPTDKNPWKGMKFTTEEFIDAVIQDVEARYEIDPSYIFTMSWSSSGPAAYAYSLAKGSRVTGSFVAMSVFKPDQLPSLKAAKGKAYYILHSPEDFIPISHAEKAEKSLSKKGAEAKLVKYSGGHGWKGDVYGNMREAIGWLERKHGKPVKVKRKKRK